MEWRSKVSSMQHFGWDFRAYRVELEAVGVAGPLSILWQQLEYLSMCLTDRHL